jgi:creatinine amidohydrolase/Fe(II)-dependent formamide hydrolase-like protein
MSYLITVVAGGARLDELDVADDGTVSSATGAAKDMGDRLVAQHGADGAREILADWSNGYLKSELQH